jgi:hypothetical protein
MAKKAWKKSKKLPRVQALKSVSIQAGWGGGNATPDWNRPGVIELRAGCFVLGNRREKGFARAS